MTGRVKKTPGKVKPPKLLQKWKRTTAAQPRIEGSLDPNIHDSMPQGDTLDDVISGSIELVKGVQLITFHSVCIVMCQQLEAKKISLAMQPLFMHHGASSMIVLKILYVYLLQGLKNLHLAMFLIITLCCLQRS